jgi:S1-C subfamily serine protease
MHQFVIFRLVLIVLMLGLEGSSAFAKGPFGSIKIGQWLGGAYTDDNTGAFTHCAAGASYLNGMQLMISQNIQGQWNVGVGSPSLNFPTGQTIPFDVIFDGQTRVRLFGAAPSSQVLLAPIPKIGLPRKANLMVVEVNGATYQFQLPSVDRVVSSVDHCLVKMKIAGVGSAGDFSAPIAKAVVQATPSTPPNPSPPKSPRTVEQTGTGFIVSTSGHVITNYHVIGACVGDIRASLAAQPSSVLRLVSTDEINDLALLQVSQTFNDVAAIRATSIHPGDAIIVIGYPLHGLLTSDFTVTSGIVSSLSGLLNDTRYLQISAEVQSGNSGGPLLDTSGNVVGVVSSKLNALKLVKATGDIPQNINFAIKTGAMRDFLDNSVVPYKTAEPKVELKTAEIAGQARAYTMLISCTAKEGN